MFFFSLVVVVVVVHFTQVQTITQKKLFVHAFGSISHIAYKWLCNFFGYWWSFPYIFSFFLLRFLFCFQLGIFCILLSSPNLVSICNFQFGLLRSCWCYRWCTFLNNWNYYYIDFMFHVNAILQNDDGLPYASLQFTIIACDCFMCEKVANEMFAFIHHIRQKIAVIHTLPHRNRNEDGKKRRYIQ